MLYFTYIFSDLTEVYCYFRKSERQLKILRRNKKIIWIKCGEGDLLFAGAAFLGNVSMLGPFFYLLREI